MGQNDAPRWARKPLVGYGSGRWSPGLKNRFSDAQAQKPLLAWSFSPKWLLRLAWMLRIIGPSPCNHHPGSGQIAGVTLLRLLCPPGMNEPGRRQKAYKAYTRFFAGSDLADVHPGRRPGHDVHWSKSSSASASLFPAFPGGAAGGFALFGRTCCLVV